MACNMTKKEQKKNLRVGTKPVHFHPNFINDAKGREALSNRQGRSNMAVSPLHLVEKDTMDKEKALEAALGQIERSFGKGSIMKLGQREQAVDIEAVSTGSLGLDIALGIGGLPRGRVVEIYGPESSGKTTLALHVIAEAQKTGGTCAFVDAEHALDPSYARKLGVDVDEMLISQPDAGVQRCYARSQPRPGWTNCALRRPRGSSDFALVSSHSHHAPSRRRRHVSVAAPAAASSAAPATAAASAAAATATAASTTRSSARPLGEEEQPVEVPHARDVAGGHVVEGEHEVQQRLGLPRRRGLQTLLDGHHHVRASREEEVALEGRRIGKEER